MLVVSSKPNSGFCSIHAYLHPGPEWVDDDDVPVDGDDGEGQRAHVHRESLLGSVGAAEGAKCRTEL